MDESVSRAIHEETARLARRARRIPAPAVLGRLRNATRGDPASALETLRAWLGGRLRAPAMAQLEGCRIDGGSLADWLRRIADEEREADLASLLRFDTLARRFHVDSEASARAHLTERATAIRAIVIDTMLAALARARRKEMRN
jgi:hypothetical protein